MADIRPEKVTQVDEIKQRFDEASSVVVSEYRGLTVESLSELRRGLRPVGGSYKVYKNTLVKKALENQEYEMEDLFLGPTALTFTDKKPDGTEGDVVSVAKVLKDFGKDHPELIIKGGIFEGNTISPEEISSLADIEPREVLLAKFAGLLAAPMQQFASLLKALPQNFAYGISSLIEKGGAAQDSDPAASSEDSGSESGDELADNSVEKEETQEISQDAAAETADVSAEEKSKEDSEAPTSDDNGE